MTPGAGRRPSPSARSRPGPTLAPLLVAAAVVGALAPGAAARAQAACGVRPRGDEAAPAPPVAWPAPLDRTISVRALDVSLREALDRLAAAARIRLSYSAELIPLDRRVCLARDGVAAGDALAELLRGAAVRPVAVAADQVVLAPAPHATGASDAAMARSVGVLDRVVVTGSAAGGSERSLPYALDVIRGAQLERSNVGTLSTILDGSVPGMWVWTQSPASLLARYGSIRGASSFGVSYPKVYIDGIEAANPLLVTQLRPESVERIEVIRGPQGAALYGADAISGVVNVVTRHGGRQAGDPRAELRTSAGVAASDYASRPTVAQEHALTLRAGSGARTGSLGVTAASVGEFAPDAFSRRLGADGALRIIGARGSISATGRLFAQRAGVFASPLVAALPAPAPAPRAGAWVAPGERSVALPGAPDTTVAAAGGEQSATAYTLGTTAVLQGERWTHSAVLGLDGYRLSGLPDDAGPVPFAAAGSPTLTASGGADRGTLRLSSVARLGAPAGAASGALTLALEHSALRERAAADAAAREAARGVRLAPVTPPARWRSSSGAIVQTNVALADALFLTGGVRLERDAGAGGVSHVTTLPMLGASVVRGSWPRGDATVKLRAAYGKGIRSPATAARVTTMRGMEPEVARAGLAPERQSGVEAGADLVVGRAFTLQVTRFDQVASGLIQRVTLAPAQQTAPWSYGYAGYAGYAGYGGTGGTSGTSGSDPRDPRRPAFGLQNVGEITNRGWELQASLGGRGPLSLAAAFSVVDSRVRRTAYDYTGDLRPGDRMLGVPARTASLTASWSGAPLFASLTLARASDWVGYDRLALARAYSAGTDYGYAAGPVGAQLRDYWRHYGGVTRLRAAASRDLRRGLALTLTGENLLGQQRDEPDDTTVLPGRTVTGGVRVRF